MKTTDTVGTWRASAARSAGEAINFYGFSYGTYLAQVYATLHPHRVRRFVLDSNVDPRASGTRTTSSRSAPSRRDRVYFGWLAEHDDVYHLGTTPR